MAQLSHYKEKNMDDLNQQIENCIAQRDYAKAAAIAESVLEQMPVTAFHKIIGRDLLHLTEEVANYLTHFFGQAQKNIDVRAMYFEMNGFSINPDMWFFGSFALSFCGNPDDPDDTDWLADYEYMLPDTVFQITGYEDLQEACAYDLNNKGYEDKIQRKAKFAFEPIVTVRFIELLAHAVQWAKDNNFPWKDVPVFGTTHGDTLLYRSPAS